MKRKQPWTAGQWEAFARRCVIVRDQISDFISDFPSTQGIRATDLDAMLKLEHAFYSALVAAENACADQHPELDNRVVGMFHPNSEPRSEADRSPRAAMFNVRGRLIRPKLTRDEWVERGRKLKASGAALRALLMELQTTIGVSRPAMRKLDRADNLVPSVKARLDSLVCKQHPEWDDFAKVFYGEQEPARV